MLFLEEHGVPNAQNLKGKRKYGKETAVMIAIRGSKVVYATMDEVMARTDMKKRTGKGVWWSDIKGLAEVMGGRSGLMASSR